MPPYRPSGRKAKEPVFIRSGVAELYPEVSALAARCIALGAQIESLYGAILITMLGANAKPAAAMYRSLQSLNAQSTVVQAAAEAVLENDELDLLAAISSLTNRSMVHRHRLAHWVWGSSSGYPDAIVLINPKMLLEYEVDLGRFSWPNEGRGLLDKFDIKTCFIYDAKALREVITGLAEAENFLAQFRFSVIPMIRRNPAMRDQGFPELARQPALMLELKSLAAKRQKNPQVPPPRPRKGRSG